jgi:CDP-2,3-bis-(O-geranylgeranyl)-sn-glycerol synthase
MTAAALLQTLWFFVPAYAANMAPVLVQGAFPALAVPIDGGRTFRGVRVLGDHKTWRGIIAGVLAGMLVFELQVALYQAGVLHRLALVDYGRLGVLPGFLLGLGTGLGDAAKSFVKRQLGIAPGASWLVFDQLDFMVGSYLLVGLVYVPPLVPTLLALPIVFVGSVATSATGWALGLKEAWI